VALLIGAQGASVLVADGAPPLVYQRLRNVLPDGMVREVADPAEHEFDVRYAVDVDDASGKLRILRDEVVVDRALHVRGLCRKLRGHVEHQIALHARTAQFAHAGVVGWRGRAVLIVGDSNAGKSTLVAELVRLGATYYSDEYAVIDDEGLVHPYARRIGPLHDFRPTEPLSPIRPAVIVATTYDPEAVWAPEVQHGARAVLPLLDHLFTTHDDPGRALRLAAVLAPTVVTLQGPRPEAVDVAPLLLDFVERTISEEAGAPYPWRDPRADMVAGDPGWAPVRARVTIGRVRFRHLERPFYFAHAQAKALPDDIDLPLRDVELAAADLVEPDRVAYVYHHGYAGSTLFGRLLDSPGTCLAYIEPSVHSGRYDDPTMRKLLYRTFTENEVPLVKALPHEAVCARRHLDDHPGGRAIFLYAPVEDFLASVLAHGYRHEYVTKMAQWLDRDIKFDDPADAAVHCWERITAAALDVVADGRLRTVAADTFFADPAATMDATWDWFGFSPRDDWQETLEQVTSVHAKQGRPFAFTDRAVQQAEYAAAAAAWRAANGAVIERGRATIDTLARFSV